MARRHSYTRQDNKKGSPRKAPPTPVLGGWSVPLVSDAVNGLLRRFATESLIETYRSPSYPDTKVSTFDSPRRRTFSPFQSLPLSPVTLHGYHSSTHDSAKLLTKSLAEEIRLLVPPRLQLCEDWNLVYSLEEDGVSLGTLYKKCASLKGLHSGFVLVVKDRRGDLFGAYLNEAPRIEPHFFGNGECFLWRASTLTGSQMNLPPLPSADTTNLQRCTTIASPDLLSPSSPFGNPLEPSRSNSSSVISERIRFKAFPYSGVNDYSMLCEAEYLSIGGGDGRYGLWLDDTFEQGISSQCPTFGNEPLSDEGEKFEVMGVEVWSIGSSAA